MGSPYLSLWIVFDVILSIKDVVLLMNPSAAEHILAVSCMQ